MSQVLVREYEVEDRSAVEKCSFELQEDEYVRESHYWGKPEEIVAPYIDYVLKAVNTDEGKIYVAEVENQIVGFIVVVLSKEEDSPAIVLKRFGYIMDLDVLRGYQGKGIGKALMEKAEEYVREKGLEWMHLHVTKNNQARDFYLKSGYTEKAISLEKKLI